jgi:hypothetical protein
MATRCLVFLVLVSVAQLPDSPMARRTQITPWYLNKLDGEVDAPDPGMLDCSVGHYHAPESAQMMQT